MWNLYFRFRWLVKLLTIVPIVGWILSQALAGVIGNTTYEWVKSNTGWYQSIWIQHPLRFSIGSFIFSFIVFIFMSYIWERYNNNWRDELNDQLYAALRIVIKNQSYKKPDAINRALYVIFEALSDNLGDNSLRFMVFEPDDVEKYLILTYSPNAGNDSFSRGKFLIINDGILNEEKKDSEKNNGILPGIVGYTYKYEHIYSTHIIPVAKKIWFADNSRYWKNTENNPPYKSIITSPIKGVLGDVCGVLCLDSHEKSIFDRPKTDVILKQVCSVIGMLMWFPEYNLAKQIRNSKQFPHRNDQEDDPEARKVVNTGDNGTIGKIGGASKSVLDWEI